MEVAVTNLEETVKQTDEKIETIAWKLNEFQKGTLQSIPNFDESISVVETLKDVDQIKEEFEMMQQRREQAQSVQRELSQSLQTQTAQVKERFAALMNKIRSQNKL